MTVRQSLLVVAVVAALAFAGRALDVRRIAGPTKGDEATYVAMAFSLAKDGDLRYDRRDFERFHALYGRGPEGIFLKESYRFGLHGETPVPTTEYLSYGKALIYPLAAAPFVWLGGLGGMLVFNLVMLAACLWAGVAYMRAATGRTSGVFLGVAFLAASVVPVFGVWLTSEIFNFTLVFLAYFLWLYKRVAPADQPSWLTRGEGSTVVAGLLLGIATFSKATNAALIGPILLEALVSGRWRRLVVVALAGLLGTAGLFGLNAVITGEANYQGARRENARRSFYGAFPFDDANTPFVASGNAMVTNDADTDRVLADESLSQVPLNTMYFFIGRHAGLVPFYFPGLVIAAVWVTRCRRAPVWQWGIFVAEAGSIAALIVFAPDSWNGGGGPPGNRYFLSLYPPLLFLATPWLGWISSALAFGVGAAFTGAMVLHPFASSASTWLNVERVPLRWLPIELTLLNDLPVRLNQRRGGILFVEEPTVLLYRFDSQTYDAEGQAFWVAGGRSTDVVIRTERPLKRLDLRFSSSIANEVTGHVGGRAFSGSVGPGHEFRFQVARPEGVRYHQSFAYLLHLSTTDGFVPAEREAGSADTRNLGVFVQPSFEYDEPVAAPTAAVPPPVTGVPATP